MPSQTFILLKPDALERKLTQDILQLIETQGFNVIKQKNHVVDASVIVKHYDDVIKRIGIKTFKPKVLKEFVGKTVVAALCEHPDDDAIDRMRQLIGATDPLLAKKDTIRGRFGMDTLTQARLEQRMLRNLIHASESLEDFLRECALWFTE